MNSCVVASSKSVNSAESRTALAKSDVTRCMPGNHLPTIQGSSYQPRSPSRAWSRCFVPASRRSPTTTSGRGSCIPPGRTEKPTTSSDTSKHSIGPARSWSSQQKNLHVRVDCRAQGVGQTPGVRSLIEASPSFPYQVESSDRSSRRLAETSEASH